MNPHSNLASFYRHFYLTEKLPNNLCNYFWSLIFAFVIIPFTWLAVLINYVNKAVTLNNRLNSDNNKMYYYNTSFKPIATGAGLMFTVLTIIIGGLGLMLLTKLGINESYFMVKSKMVSVVLLMVYGYGLAFIFCSIGLFKFIMVFIRLLPKKTPETDEEYRTRRKKENAKDFERMEYKRNNPSFISLTWAWLVAFKEENCPMIDWDYTKKK